MPDIPAAGQDLADELSTLRAQVEALAAQAEVQTGPPGQLEGFQAQAAEILRLAQEQYTQTLHYDWFLNQDEASARFTRAYLSEQGLIEHNEHVVAVRDAWFRDYAFEHRMSVYGEISQHMSDLFAKHAGGVSKFSLVQGLEQPAPVWPL